MKFAIRNTQRIHLIFLVHALLQAAHMAHVADGFVFKSPIHVQKERNLTRVMKRAPRPKYQEIPVDEDGNRRIPANLRRKVSAKRPPLGHVVPKGVKKGETYFLEEGGMHKKKNFSIADIVISCKICDKLTIVFKNIRGIRFLNFIIVLSHLI